MCIRDRFTTPTSLTTLGREGRAVIMNPLVHSALLYRACALLGRITTLPVATADVVCHTRHRARWGKHWRKETRDCSRFHRGGGTDRDLCWQTGALQKMKKIYSVKLCGLERKANRGAKRSTRRVLLLQSCYAMVRTAGRMDIELLAVCTMCRQLAAGTKREKSEISDLLHRTSPSRVWRVLP